MRPSYVLRRCERHEIMELIERYHPYGGASAAFTYVFAVWEGGRPVAAYCWMPPPFGASKSVCKEAPQGVLALSRMVAVPRDERELNHVSKPLRRQMRVMIDRDRWPVLITYSDESLGHTGHVYKCSGWKKTVRSPMKYYLNEEGVRVSKYTNGKSRDTSDLERGHGFIQRWEHWSVEPGQAQARMEAAGWKREPTGKTWASGNPAHRWVKSTQLELI